MPARIRSASSATLRREATISAKVSSAGATGELLTPVETGMPSSVAAAKSSMCELRPTSAMQLELGQPLQQRARELDPLADRHHHVGVLQPLDELVEIARRLAIALHVVVADQREARKLIDHVLVVVGDDDFHEMLEFLCVRLSS